MSETLTFKAEANEAIDRLNDLRETAEKHLDEAQEALFDDNVSDEDALAHLDAALNCVKDMLPQDIEDGTSEAA